jgi:hypothetical protein
MYLPYLPDPKNPDPPKKAFSPFPLLQPIKKEFRLPKGNKEAGFPPSKIGYSGFQARKPDIGKNVIKKGPIRPVTANWPKREYA